MTETSEQRIEATCRQCGHKWQALPVVLPMLRAPIIPSICETCDEECERQAATKARIESAARKQKAETKRADQWQKLCPREYRLTTESDGKTQLAKLELECRQLPRILAWNYGERGLVIRSRESGLCKTRAAWRLIRKHWNDGRSIIAYTAGAFQRRAQDEAGKFNITAWFNNIAAADLLFLDDLGKGYWTENTEAVWFDLLEHRTSQGRPIIVTTNYSGQELIKGSRSEATTFTVRRLRDYCDTISLD